ncbi:MAG: dihydroorotate dehydrogenase 2 [Pyrobaculum sp.]
MALLRLVGRLAHYVHPEISHKLGSLIFSIPLPSCRCDYAWEVGEVKVCGPVGVAAGLDKTGLYARFLSFFCPGFIVVGSTLLYSRRGNKPPRLARARPYSLVNAMGLGSPGIPRVVARVSALRYPVFISLAGFSVGDFLVQIEYLQKFFKPAAVELNLSSPTYRGFWRAVPDIPADVPVFVKLGPSQDVLTAAAQAKRRRWGVVVTNTLPIDDVRISVGRGGLSGLLLYKYGVKVLEKVRRVVGDGVPVIYAGGVFTCSQLREVLRLADAAEVLTAVLYFTPYVLKLLNQCEGIGRR